MKAGPCLICFFNPKTGHHACCQAGTHSMECALRGPLPPFSTCSLISTKEQPHSGQSYAHYYDGLDSNTSVQAKATKAKATKAYCENHLGIMEFTIRGISVSHLVVPDSLRPHGLQPTRLLCP